MTTKKTSFRRWSRGSNYLPKFHESIADIQGFSLVELLVALTLFSFLVTGIITFVTAGLEVTKKTEGQLSVQQDRSKQERQLENALIFPVERIDSGISSVATTSGAIFQINGTSVFIGTQSMTGTCTWGLNQQYLVTHQADGLTNGETHTGGNYTIANDGLSVYSGSVRIIGSGIRGGNNGLPLETELGWISSITSLGNILVLADPNNEQLLFWNGTSRTLSTITTRATGIVSPSSVKFSGGSLLIGAKNGLFRMSDSTASGNILSKTVINWSVSDLWNIGKIQVAFDGIPSLSASITSMDVTLEKQVAGIWQSMNDPSDMLTVSGSGFTYTFSGTTRNLLAGEAVRIGIANISPAPSVTEQYSANMVFYDTVGTWLRSTKIPYFVKWDSNISTLAGNVIEWLSPDSNVRTISDISVFESGALSMDNYLNTEGKKLVSTLPIRDFRVVDTADSIIITFEEYSIYDCREWNHRSQKRTFILRKKK